uniref:Integrase, catalytic region, zinc finger, CCHC-type, peptidase aspartic, catalytic n=1 Tax=Tanacetum cinerariifolium TaxID=118510 RepID=A0A6L2LAL1_TANCI|nr:hypothetical protein [Tanacetum cinerariifolium]
MQTQTSNTLHNAIIEAGGKDRPPMLAPSNYVKWKSKIKRYIDSKPNHELIHYCLKNPPYKFTWADKEVPISEGSSVTTTETYMETYKNVSQDICDQLNAEAEAVQIILTWIAMKGHVAGTRETVGTTVVQKSGIQCYNCKEKMILCKQEKTEIQLNAKLADWRDDTDDESEDHELEAHYMYMAQIQEVSPDAADSGRIFDSEPVQKVSTDDHYNVFDIESQHPKQSESVHDTYPIEQDQNNVSIDSLDMSYDREHIDQNYDDDDPANERELLASLIKKLKSKIDDNKNRHKFLETSNKVLDEKLKGEIEDFKNKNKSLESSNNHFKEASNKLSETNKLLYNDFKKSQAELKRRNDVEYTTKIKLYKTREDKELDKVIALENKVKVLDNIVYKTGQSVQTMNMLNNKCQTSFTKPEFLKKAPRANPRLYDIGCYNDNLALMLAPESDEESFNKQTTLLEKQMDESTPWGQKCKSSKELFKTKRSVGTLFDGVERCKETIAKRTYFGHIDPFIQNTIEANFSPEIQKINVDLEKFHVCLKEEMVADLRYFNSLELEVYSLKSQLETQKTQFLNEIDRLSREYYYANHMNAIFGMYTELVEVTNLQCDYLELLEKYECLEKELSKSQMMSKSSEALQKHAINLEINL